MARAGSGPNLRSELDDNDSDEEVENEDGIHDGASEEGSEGSGHEETNIQELVYPLPDSWSTDVVEDCPLLPDGIDGSAEITAGVPPFTPFEDNPGVAHNLDLLPEDSVLAHFRLFYTDEIFNKFLTAINNRGSLKEGVIWKPVSLPEFKGFLACVLQLGIVTYPNRRAAWSMGPTGSLFLRKIMSRDRFDSIMKHWRYVDKTTLTNQHYNESRANDPFFAVADYCEVLRVQYVGLWNPSQFLDIDEQTIPWKGRHTCRNYNPNKPEKWHFKVWCLNDSTTGYLLNFYLYRGKAENRPPGIPASAYPAYSLLEPEKFHNRGHVLTTDNFFTSCDEVALCSDRGIETIGTVRLNRQGLPPATRRRLVRGEIVTRRTVWRGKLLWYTEWQDRKTVRMLHTFPTFRGKCTRNVKGPTGWVKNIYDRGTIIYIYNKYMGGTDSMDQRVACYRPVVKTRTWMQRVFTHFLNVTVTNCFLYCKATKRLQLPQDHLTFRQQLINELCDDLWESRRLQATETIEMAPKSNSLKHWENDRSRLAGLHLPEMEYTEHGKNIDSSGNLRENGNSDRRNYERGRCLLCRRKLSIKCSTCGVYLCVLNDEEGNNCFKEWHTKAKFRERVLPAKRRADDDSD